MRGPSHLTLSSILLYVGKRENYRQNTTKWQNAEQQPRARQSAQSQPFLNTTGRFISPVIQLYMREQL